LGALFSASFLVGAVLTAPVGVGADRFGRKPFLVAFTVLMLIWGLAYTTTGYVPVLLVVSAVAGVGRGGGGMGSGQAGPFGPAELAWLADLVPEASRRRVFSWNGVLSALAAAIGALAAAAPSLFHRRGVSLLATDRPLFVMTAVIAVLSLVLLRGTPETVQRANRERPTRAERPVQIRRRGPVSRASLRLVARQALAGGSNALGVGFVNSLFVVWLHLRFHASAAAIGPVFALSYLLSALSIFAAGAVARRAGSVRTIVAARVLAAGLMAGTALAPTFAVAVGLQVLRTAATMMIVPVRQAFTMSLFPAGERGSAAGITGVVRRLAGSASPPLSGAMFDAGLLELPFFLGTACQLLSAALYRVFFQSLDTAKAAAGVGPELVDEAATGPGEL
jgi:MFS family permease